ncbi:MAG: DUF3515 domain-containing protein [Marmoricola sp.]
MAGVIALLVLFVTACGKVDVAATSVTASERTTCTALVKALPDHVSDQAQVETKGNPLGAAWGDPAIVLRCGVGKAAGYDKFASCQTVNGVDWFVPEKMVSDQSADVVSTTLGRTPAIEVSLPATYRPPAAAMVDLAGVIKAHTQVLKRCS